MHVYVLDDDAAMCRTLQRLVARADISMTSFNVAGTFLDALDSLADGVLLLDINLPGTRGLDLLGDLARRRPAMPIVMISGTTEVDDAIAAFRGGAIQFLRKPFRRTDLDRALADAMRVGTERASRLAQADKAAAIKLSKREREVLTDMANGLQSKVIAHRLGISVRTVDMHRGNIFAKLTARNATQAVAIARQLELFGDGIAA